MELKDIQALLATPEELVKEILLEHDTKYNEQEYKKYESVKNHDVFDTTKRPNKKVEEAYEDENGAECKATKLVPVNRIGFSMQKHIVDLSSVFTAGGGVTLSPVTSITEGSSSEALFNQLKKTWRENKLDFKNVKIAEAVMSQTECAEVWYTDRSDPRNPKLKCRLYQPKDGYKLIPIKNDEDDMVAYAISYVVNDTSSSGKVDQKEYLLLWTAEKQYSFMKEGTSGKWVSETETDGVAFPTANLIYGKIPVMHFSVNNVEWADVDPLITRMETQASNFADNNDYNSSPILFAKGEVLGMAEKGEAGKLIQGDKDTTLEYIGWQHAPEAVKQEHNTLKEMIYLLSQTPNLSPETLRGLGDISGPAFDRMMMNAHLKALKYQVDWFGETIQRRVNFLLAACRAVYSELRTTESQQLQVSAKFELFQIKDMYRIAQTLALATGNKPYVTQEQAAAVMGISDDPKATIEQVRAETAASGTPTGADFNTIQQAGASGQPTLAT